MEEEVMQNIDIKDFELATGLNDDDYVVLSLGNGTSARASVALLKMVFTAVISPNVKEGVWFVGDKSLEVNAEGKTPELRRGSMGIEWKYTTEDSWKMLVSYTDIKLQYDALTNEQKDEIITGVNAQVHDEVIQPVNEAVEAMNTATSNAISAMELATNTAVTNLENVTNEAVTELQKATEEAVKEVEDAVEEMERATESAINDAEDATKDAIEATKEANSAALSATEAAEAANKYANRVRDITPEEWDELEKNQSWEQGVEYNVYE